MATNGSTKVKVTDYNNLVFSWWQISQSLTDNSTTIGWKMELTAGSYGRIVSSAFKTWRVVIGGQTYTDSTYIAIENNAVKTLASGQTTLTHGSDGTRSFDISFSQEFNITFNGVQIGTKTGSGTYSLNAIVQAKTLTLGATSVTMGQAQSITVAQASSSETYDIAYSFANQDYVNLATGLTSGNATLTWTVPIDLAYLIPDAMRDVVTLRCTTYRGGSVLGTKTVAFYAVVPDYVPSIDSVTFEDTNTDAKTNIGSFLRGASKLEVNIEASGVYGSTIKSIKSTFLNKNYTGATWKSSVLDYVGTYNIVITITDSRGRTQSGPKAVTILDYKPPSITSFTASRYNTSGQQDEDGTRVKAPISYSFTSISGKNSVDLKIEYKQSQASSFSTLWNVSDHTAGETTATPTTDLSTDYQYDLRLTVTDKAGSKATYTAVLPSGAVILDLKADGKGIAFFKTSTKDGVEIAGELPGSPIELKQGQSIDALTEPGYYVALTNAIAGSIAGSPFSDGKPFSVEVTKLGTGIIKRTLHSSTGGIYEMIEDSTGSVTGRWVYTGPNRTLWSGGLQMTASQTATLSQAISEQANGIVLIFSRWEGGAAANYFYSCHFVPKQLAEYGGIVGAATVFNISTTLFDYISNKYLYIGDSLNGTGYIRGNDDNTKAGTKNGITYDNGKFALKYVIGV